MEYPVNNMIMAECICSILCNNSAIDVIIKFIVYHFIGIYNIVSVIHHNTQQSVMDRVKIIIQRHKNWSTQELTFPQYLLQYYTQVKKKFF
jgi:hypothetical protein